MRAINSGGGRKPRRVMQCGIAASTAAMLVASTLPPHAQGLALEYGEGFTADPEWTTDQRGEHFSDSVTGTCHATTANAQPDPSLRARSRRFRWELVATRIRHASD